MATGDLTTLAAVKAYLSLTDTSADSLLSSLITSASSYVAQYTGRNFFVASYTETYNGLGGDRLALRNTPVTAVASVTVDGVAMPAFGGYGSSSYGFAFDSDLLYAVNRCFTRAPRNVIVSYTAGYAAADLTGLPGAIQQAVNEMVAIKFKRRTNIDVRSETLATQTITYASTDITPAVLAVLNAWNTVAPVA